MRKFAVLMGMLALAGCGEEMVAPVGHFDAQSQGLTVKLDEVSGKVVRFQVSRTGENWELSVTPDTRLIARGRPAKLSQFHAGSKVRVVVEQAMFLDMDNLWVGRAAQLTLLD